MASSFSNELRPHHKRSTSAVLKSIINPRAHKRSPSDGTVLANRTFDDNYGLVLSRATGPSNTIPTDSNGEQLPLSDISHNDARKRMSPSKRETDWTIHDEKALEGKSKYGALGALDQRPKPLGADESPWLTGFKSSKNAPSDTPKKPKKTKSQTSLAAIFSRPKGPKAGKTDVEVKEKENTTPPTSSYGSGPPPIYAQFASQPLQSQLTPSLNVNSGQAKGLNDEIALYTPTQYGANQQRNFNDTRRPSLSQRPSASRPRPYSIHVSSTSSSSSFKDVMTSARRSSGERMHPTLAGHDNTGHVRRFSQDLKGGQNAAAIPKIDGQSQDSVPGNRRTTVAKRGARVMAAVASFNNKAKEPEVFNYETDQNIAEAFEKLLDTRNIPDNMRPKMRALDLKIKADFIRQDRVETQKKPKVLVERSSNMEETKVYAGNTLSSSRKLDPVINQSPSKVQTNSSSPSKRARPLSKSFSFHKNDRDGSPMKRQKSREESANGEGEAVGPTVSSTPSKWDEVSSKIQNSISSLSSPEDFVKYLQRVQEPKSVEVGKLHKLRLVLRNERVAWVNAFISNGGMKEVVGLLDRLMKVEWREEHEDTLMHETLLCLKALCTTATALQELVKVQSDLFPALLGMLFDKEKKGPSEFTTRGLIISIILTYLASAPPKDLESRAQRVLQYMRDPAPPEDAQPLDFIVSMQKSRPYRVWCKEVTDVTKEVFWIFLHNVNVISVRSSEATDGSYAQIHFPKERPPVPAAPYVGGVEWDATNYLTTHLDLMNAVIASLHTREERNSLRQELRVSGFEKIMGGSLRTCKEKFYGSVHDALRTWVAAAFADGWDYKDVRNGPPEPVRPSSPKKKGNDKNDTPKLDLPKLDLEERKEPGLKSEAAWVL